jgi:hypothetical protein
MDYLPYLLVLAAIYAAILVFNHEQDRTPRVPPLPKAPIPPPIKHRDPRRLGLWQIIISEGLSAIVTAWALGGLINSVRRHREDDY